jgi:uncharacterized protein YozE (UPF0346 family)
MHISFKRWIIKHKDDDTPIGDLARDMIDDKNCPNAYGKMCNHLKHMRACAAALETLDDAWSQYKSREV